MKVRKNLEGVFLVAAVLTTFATYATAEIPTLRADRAPVAVEGTTQVVVVSAKRLSAEEKAALN